MQDAAMAANENFYLSEIVNEAVRDLGLTATATQTALRDALIRGDLCATGELFIQEPRPWHWSERQPVPARFFRDNAILYPSMIPGGLLVTVPDERRCAINIRAILHSDPSDKPAPPPYRPDELVREEFVDTPEQRAIGRPDWSRSRTHEVQEGSGERDAREIMLAWPDVVAVLDRLHKHAAPTEPKATPHSFRTKEGRCWRKLAAERIAHLAQQHALPKDRTAAFRAIGLWLRDEKGIVGARGEPLTVKAMENAPRNKRLLNLAAVFKMAHRHTPQ